ncbi:basic leucine zipper 6 [Lolium perenne]|uniref:basic leucine zipper 6 n=1 Tax=Lolium perenne TaxID=4522 RepID=UPI0021EB34B0|nr:basic leucine zipper 6-like [Lolium perenne]
MAQLPPKIPMAAGAHHWPGTGAGVDGHHHGVGVGAAAAWADEFAEFAAARRGAHRRSLSDSVAFVEVAPGAGDFDRLDDDQLMSMFPDEGGSTAPGSENGSSDSDGDKRKDRYGNEKNDGANDPEETAPGQATPTSSTETIRDPKRVKRILANRQSAQRSRVRKLQYISELERCVTTLQNEVSVLSPRVAFLDQQRTILTVGNSHLKQRIAALAQDKIFKDAHQEALKEEIERLRQVYQQQNLRMSSGAAADQHAHGGPPPVRQEKELMS